MKIWKFDFNSTSGTGEITDGAAYNGTPIVDLVLN